MENELAKVYMNSKRAEADFADFPATLRQAISLARRLRDPLPEFCQLYTPDQEILCLSYHPLQDQVQGFGFDLAKFYHWIKANLVFFYVSTGYYK